MLLVTILLILLLTVGVFFGFTWLLKKYVKEIKTRNWIAILATFITVPIIYIVVMIFILGYLFHEPQHEFNKEQWFAEKQKRYEMRDDMVIPSTF